MDNECDGILSIRSTWPKLRHDLWCVGSCKYNINNAGTVTVPTDYQAGLSGILFLLLFVCKLELCYGIYLTC